MLGLDDCAAAAQRRHERGDERLLAAGAVQVGERSASLASRRCRTNATACAALESAGRRVWKSAPE